MSNIDALDSALAEIIRELEAAEARVETLRMERLGAEALIARLQRTGHAVSPNSPTPAPYRKKLGNIDVVIEVLTNVRGGMHLQEIMNAAADRGSALNSEQVRSAVTYLKRKGEAERLGPGLWRLTEATAPPTDAESAAATALSVTSLTDPGEGGEGIGTRSHRDHDQDQEHRDHSGGAPAVGG